MVLVRDFQEGGEVMTKCDKPETDAFGFCRNCMHLLDFQVCEVCDGEGGNRLGECDRCNGEGCYFFHVTDK